MGSVPNILSGAKKALEKAQSFTKSVEGKTPSTFASSGEKYPAAQSQYSRVREARRKEPGEFMGVRSDQAPELKYAERARGQYGEALKAAEGKE